MKIEHIIFNPVVFIHISNFILGLCFVFLLYHILIINHCRSAAVLCQNRDLDETLSNRGIEILKLLERVG